MVILPKKYLLLVVLVVILPCFAVGQNLGNLKTKKLAITSDTTTIDLLSLVPGSTKLFINDDSVSRNNYLINSLNAQLIWFGSYPKDSVTITYRVLPINFTERANRKDAENLSPDDQGNYNPFSYTAGDNAQDFMSSGGLNKSGSISRGIAFGNNQDLSVNSNLQLQLSGRLNERFSVLASVTDENIPIQPDGNTQQLQDFDQVFIQVFDEKTKLIAGDFQLRRPNSYFMNYFKKAQGGSITTRIGLGQAPLDQPAKKPLNLTIQASGAASRGKFARNIIQGIEGNQGPYRLRGADNETFIIVLSGTERVFIDGELLVRGQDNDYVIDYNSSEITFTPNRLITKDKRIIIEFQYSDKNYARSLLQFGSTLEGKKFDLRFNVYSEQDSKNQPLQQDLSDDDKEVLSLVGDNLNAAIVPSADSVEFSNESVLYAIVDSLGYDSVFVNSTNPDSAFYTVNFTNVGSGNGFYIKSDFTASGSVFQWIAPDTSQTGQIILKGEYEPITVLLTPKKQQLITLGGEYRFNPNNRVGFEVGLSNTDINTFSTLDANDNVGFAVKTYIENRKPLQKKDNAWTLVSNADFEMVDENFRAIERFRPAEFERNWNLTPSSPELLETQYITTAGVALEKKKTGRVQYLFDALIVGDEYTGLKNNLLADFKGKGYFANVKASYLQTDGANVTEFFRHKSNLSKTIKFVKIGFQDEHERNIFQLGASDTLLVNSYEFYDWEVSLGRPDTAKNQVGVFYRQRTDWNTSTAENRLKKTTFAEWYGFNFQMIKNRNSQLRSKTAFRRLTITDSALTTQAPDNTLVSRLEYTLRLFKGAVTSNTFYEIGTGLEQRKEFVYLQVPAGQGQYAWIDYDDDNVKDLNEFEIAAFSDQAEYIRVFTPTNEYVKTFTNQFNQTLNIKPVVVWSKKKGFLKFLTRFNNTTAFRIDRKTNNEDLSTAYNPFIQDIADTTLLSLNSSFRNTIFFNRSSNKYGIDYTYFDIGGKQLLTSGFDSRSNKYHEGRVRWNITKQITLVSRGSTGTKSNASDFLNGRNYNLNYQTGEVQFSYQPSTSFRISTTGKYTEKRNTEDLGGEIAILRDLGVELRYSVVSKGNFLLNVNYISIYFDGLANTSLAFEMLDALQVGQNVTWSLAFQRNLSKNLQLSLNYNGRTSQTTRTIHSGGMSVRAFF